MGQQLRVFMRLISLLSAGLLAASALAQSSPPSGQQAAKKKERVVWHNPAIKQLRLALKEDPAACVQQAQTLLASAQTTEPALREKIEMATKCAQVAVKGDVSVAADFVDLFRKANANEREALFGFCPPLVGVKPWRGAHGLEAIDALQATADAEGYKVPDSWAQITSCFKMKRFIENGQIAEGVEILKRLPDMDLTLLSEDNRKSSLRLGPEPRNALLRQATPDQLEAAAAAMGRLATAIEKQCGQKADAWALSSEWKANAQRAGQLAVVKRAALAPAGE